MVHPGLNDADTVRANEPAKLPESPWSIQRRAHIQCSHLDTRGSQVIPDVSLTGQRDHRVLKAGILCMGFDQAFQHSLGSAPIQTDDDMKDSQSTGLAQRAASTADMSVAASGFGRRRRRTHHISPSSTAKMSTLKVKSNDPLFSGSATTKTSRTNTAADCRVRLVRSKTYVTTLICNPKISPHTSGPRMRKSNHICPSRPGGMS